MELVLKQVGLSSQGFRIEGISLTLSRGSCGVLMGATGEGKSSLIEAICGLRKIDSGKIFLNGRNLARVVPGERGIGLVPQDAVLFPHLTVREQLGFSSRLRGLRGAELESRCREVAEALQIDHLLGRRSIRLSGGEAKRVALGRALAGEPVLLCLDEPFAGLDAATRGVVEEVVAAHRTRTESTVLLVTHDRGEARRLGDKAWSLSEGRLSRINPGMLGEEGDTKDTAE